MAEFVGLHVHIALNNGLALEGTVHGVNQATQNLTLHNVVVTFDGTKSNFATYSVAGNAIQSLSVIPDSSSSIPQPPQQQQQPRRSSKTNRQNGAPMVHAPSSQTLPPPPPPPQAPYMDPAIVSFSSKPVAPVAAPLVSPTRTSLSSLPVPPQRNLEDNDDNDSYFQPALGYPPAQHAKKSSKKESRQKGKYAASTGQFFPNDMVPLDQRESKKKNKKKQEHNNTYDEGASQQGYYGYYSLDGPTQPQGLTGYGVHNEAHNTPTKKRGKNRHERGGRQSPGRPGRPAAGSLWSNSDVASYKMDEFDFQTNLEMFDKAKVFDEIRQLDGTAPETLLVNINQRQQWEKHIREQDLHASRTQRKLRHDENVLSGSEESEAESNDVLDEEGSSSTSLSSDTDSVSDSSSNDNEFEEEESNADLINGDNSIAYSYDQTESRDGTRLYSEDDFEGSELEMRKQPLHLLTKTSSSGSAKKKGKKTKLEKRPIFRSSMGVDIYGVTNSEWTEIERLTVTETGPNEEQMIENGGRNAAMMVLQAWGSRRLQRSNHNAPPLVVVLAGNNKTGAMALCAGRHLANREVRVMAFVVSEEENLGLNNMVAYQQKILLPTGAEILKTISDLPMPSFAPVDLIIDGLMGTHQQYSSLSSERSKFLVSELVRWANDNKAPVLSLDCPCGIDPTTGSPITHLYVTPKWTLCMGIPKSGLTNRHITGELFLADVAIPKFVFDKVPCSSLMVVSDGDGARVPEAVSKNKKQKPLRYRPPFADKFLVGLEVISADS